LVKPINIKLAFLGLYVVYIFVVCFGRYINQKRKKATGQFVNKNDFSSENKKSIIRNESYERNNLINEQEEEDVNQEDDSLEDDLTRPLMSGHSHNHETDDADVQYTYTSAILECLNPIDLNEWKESNYLFKFMAIVKAPVMIILKLTTPLVDYETANHNWNKVTMIINCLTAPLFMVFAIKIGNTYINNVMPVWAIALILSVLLAVLVFFLTDMNHKPKYHFVSTLF
jgi:hypothetical protein